MSALALLYVGFGGAFGSMLRYALVQLVTRTNATAFPFGTLAVNVSGSLLMGVWLASVATFLPADKARDLHLLVAVGAFGGFTTFSGFSVDVFMLAEQGLYTQMACYIGGSVLLSVAALVLGMLLVQWAAA